jgi:PKD repeat protein
MKNLFFLAITMLFITNSWSQEGPVKPTIIRTGTYYGLTPPLRELPVISEAEFQEMQANAEIERNPELEHRSYPFAATALPKGPDPAWQHKMGINRSVKEPILNFEGQISPYFPPDANGTIGPLYYMQTINTVYAIYNKTDGALVAGPTNMNQLFTGVTGSNCNDGDPLILFDEQANRWLAAELSICGSNDRMLVAVSQTSDPTGSWYKYSFDVDDMPDYEKFGIWQDGYYMGTNNDAGNDIYVFERSQMLTGGTARMVGFNNPWRPTTIDGFMCVPPVDNDGPYAPTGEPGLFITINDDAIGGGSDQLWIYELAVDWATPANSTFNLSQQLNVPAFDSNFGNSWDNIRQPGTNQRLDAIPMIIMNRPQYRNFGSYETLVCCHTVDLDNTNHAGIRWYELRRAGGEWSIRQSGTYGPDEHNRWMGSVSLNGSHEIGLAYSVSSTTVYPSIRYCGQSASEYATGSGVLDVAETEIQTGAHSQTSYNRWGDYADLSVDPDNDHTFWFTSEYIGSGGSRHTKIATFEFAPNALTALFTNSDPEPCEGDTVAFTDQSAGTPIAWNWTFEGGTPAASTLENPEVVYNQAGVFDVQLIISDGNTFDTILQVDYIHVFSVPGEPALPSGPADVCKGDNNLEYVTFSVPDAISYEWSINPPEAGTFTGNDTVGSLSVSDIYAGSIFVSVQAVNNCGASNYSDSLLVDVYPPPEQYNMVPDGGYCEGGEGFEILLDGSQTVVSYELFRNDTTTGIILPGTGAPLSFGLQAIPGTYTITAHRFTCSAGMNDSTDVYLLPAVETAAKPTGSTEECNYFTGAEYSTTGAVNATYYIWQLDPPEAGVISGSSMVGTVEWSPVYYGLVLVKVQGADDCGPGPLSDGLGVSVLDAPHPLITGDTAVCNQAAGDVYPYSSIENSGDEYNWSVENGVIVSGQGTSQVFVSWTGLDSGSISLVETSQAGCVASAVAFSVSIYDCTGIGEKELNKVFIYPNPVENELTLKCELGETGNAQLKIYNFFGQEILKKEINTGNGEVVMTLSTEDFANGAYSVKLISPGGKLYEGKFLKMK